MPEKNAFAWESPETHVPHSFVKYTDPGASACSPPALFSKNIFSILDIPHILIAVRGHLSKSSIRFCCLVSHDFHELFIPGLWQKLEIGFSIRENDHGYGGYPSVSFREAIVLYGHYVRQLSFVACPTRTLYFFRGVKTQQDLLKEELTLSQAAYVPPPFFVTLKDNAKSKIASALHSRRWKRKVPREEKAAPSTPVVTMAQSPLPIAALGREDPRRDGATGELCPNLTSLHIEISPRMSRGWIIQESELVILFVARNQGLRSLTIDNFPTRSQTMVALFFRVLSEQAGLQELRLWQAQEVSGGLFQALLLNLPRAGREHDDKARNTSSLQLLEVKWSVDDDKYTEGYWSHGEWHQHDPNHPDRLQAPTLGDGPDGPGSVSWPIYSTLSVVRFLGNLKRCEDSVLIPFLKNACLNLMELHCHRVQAEKREAIRQATRATICCFEDENNCICNEISA